MLKLCCQKVFGYVPEHLNFEWKPLRIMTNKEESDLKTQDLTRCLEAYRSGLLSIDSAVAQINSLKIFPIDISAYDAQSLEEMSDEAILPKSVSGV